MPTCRPSKPPRNLAADAAAAASLLMHLPAPRLTRLKSNWTLACCWTAPLSVSCWKCSHLNLRWWQISPIQEFHTHQRWLNRTYYNIFEIRFKGHLPVPALGFQAPCSRHMGPQAFNAANPTRIPKTSQQMDSAYIWLGGAFPNQDSPRQWPLYAFFVTFAKQYRKHQRAALRGWWHHFLKVAAHSASARQCQSTGIPVVRNHVPDSPNNS